MANVFDRVTFQVTGTTGSVYTCPAATTSIVIGCQASNVTGSTDVDLDLVLDDGVDTRYLVKGVVIPEDAALNPIAGKLVLTAGDELLAVSTSTNGVELVLSVLEIS